jgi:hypothetical protein
VIFVACPCTALLYSLLCSSFSQFSVSPLQRPPQRRTLLSTSPAPTFIFFEGAATSFIMPPPPGLDFAGAQGHKPNMTRSPDSDDVWHTSLPPMIVDSATPPSSYKPPSSYREREGGQPHRRPTHPKMVLPPIRTLLNEQLSSDCTPPSSTASSPINSASLRRLPYRDCHSAISTTSTNESSPHLVSYPCLLEVDVC